MSSVLTNHVDKLLSLYCILHGMSDVSTWLRAHCNLFQTYPGAEVKVKGGDRHREEEEKREGGERER